LIPEQRRHLRYTIRVPLYVTVEGGVLRKRVALESRDVSAGGVCFETGHEVPLDAETRLVIAPFGDLGDTVVILGRVVRVQPDSATKRPRVGVEFTGFVNVTQESLVRHLERWQAAAIGRTDPGASRVGST
jgi:c-di-GMP-binding flagellar brake protein YcgR